MSNPCRAANPATCRIHGTEFARTLLLPGKTPRDFGLPAPEFEAYAAETIRLQKRLTGEEGSSLHYYTSFGYSYINGWLRNGLEGLIDAEIHDNYNHINSNENRNRARHRVEGLEQRIAADIRNMDSAFAKTRHGKQSRVLYKAYRVRSQLNPNLTSATEINDYVREHYPVGKIFTNLAYTSTSIDPDYMLVHARRRPSQMIVHEIITDKGLPLHDPSSGSIQSSEREILLPRNMRLEVVNVTRATFEHSGLGPDMNHWGKPVPQRKRFVVVQFREIG